MRKRVTLPLLVYKGTLIINVYGLLSYFDSLFRKFYNSCLCLLFSQLFVVRKLDFKMNWYKRFVHVQILFIIP